MGTSLDELLNAEFKEAFDEFDKVDIFYYKAARILSLFFSLHLFIFAIWAWSKIHFQNYSPNFSMEIKVFIFPFDIPSLVSVPVFLPLSLKATARL